MLIEPVKEKKLQFTIRTSDPEPDPFLEEEGSATTLPKGTGTEEITFLKDPFIHG